MKDADDALQGAVELNAVLEESALVVDRELQAAIEYKIATSGVHGVERILEFVDHAVRRHIAGDPQLPR
jgi:hypothetical protein